MGRLLATVLLIAACGETAPGISLAEFRSEELRARCDYLTRCGLFADHARCTTYFPIPSFVAAPPEPSLVAAIEAGKVLYDGAAALQCVDELTERSCDVTLREGREPLVCNRVR